MVIVVVVVEVVVVVVVVVLVLVLVIVVVVVVLVVVVVVVLGGGEGGLNPECRITRLNPKPYAQIPFYGFCIGFHEAFNGFLGWGLDDTKIPVSPC